MAILSFGWRNTTVEWTLDADDDDIWLNTYLIHIYIYIYICIHQSTIPCGLLKHALLQGQPSKLKRRQLHQATPRTEVKLHGSSDRQRFLASLLQNYATLGDVPRFAGTPSKGLRFGFKIKRYRLSKFWTFVTMVCCWNDELSGHDPSSILDKRHDVSETGVCLRHQVKTTPTVLGPTERASPYPVQR
jgi:hypothetical protein